MIQILFKFLDDMEIVVIDGKNVMFGNTTFGAKLATIDGLKLDYAGVIREFPDLELNPEWREISIERFKEKINKMKTEREIASYLIDELQMVGHKPLKIQLGSGYRWRKVKDDSK